jgi:RimJ/RimL family protein N-acetyltransferase
MLNVLSSFNSGHLFLATTFLIRTIENGLKAQKNLTQKYLQYFLIINEFYIKIRIPFLILYGREQFKIDERSIYYMHDLRDKNKRKISKMSFLSRITNRPPYRIIGQDCILQPLVNRDMKKINSWLENKDLIKFAFGVIADDKVLNRISSDYMHNFFSSSTEIIGIWVDQNTLVGFINYSVTRYRDFTARIGILLGEEDNRNKGIGTRALNIALLYLFDRRGLEKIELDTASFNTRAQKCFLKCGFKKVREVSELNFFSGQMVHKILMELYREDFLENIYERFNELPKFEGKLPESRFLDKLKIKNTP